jgi:hypothetical protein
MTSPVEYIEPSSPYESFSPVDISPIADFEGKDKWQGFFSLKWLFIKDIQNKSLKNIKNGLN